MSKHMNSKRSFHNEVTLQWKRARLELKMSNVIDFRRSHYHPKHLDNWTTLNCSVNAVYVYLSIKRLLFSDDYQVSHKTGDAYTYILITFSDQYTHTFTQSHTPASEGH